MLTVIQYVCNKNYLKYYLKYAPIPKLEPGPETSEATLLFTYFSKCYISTEQVNNFTYLWLAQPFP